MKNYYLLSYTDAGFHSLITPFALFNTKEKLNDAVKVWKKQCKEQDLTLYRNDYVITKLELNKTPKSFI